MNWIPKFEATERVGDDVFPTTVQMIRDTMKEGKRYGDLDQRMVSFEALLAKLVSSRPAKQNSLTSERLLQRAADAKIAAQLSDVPSFFLLAAPIQPVKLSGLYSGSKSAEYKAIGEPPTYRQHGFDPRTTVGGRSEFRISPAKLATDSCFCMATSRWRYPAACDSLKLIC